MLGWRPARMTKPNSLDLRERVTERVAAGDSVRAVATIFTVSVASVVRWWQRLRRTGSAAGGKMGGHRACTLIGERGWLMERIAAEPEVTVRGLMTKLAERGVSVSYGTDIDGSLANRYYHKAVPSTSPRFYRQRSSSRLELRSVRQERTQA